MAKAKGTFGPREVKNAVRKIQKYLEDLELNDEDLKEVADLRTELDTLEERLESGRLTIALVGSTNAGKSALMNAILGENKAKVSAKTDTTTEQQLEYWRVGNCELVDTPGIEAVDGERSREIAYRYAELSDMVLFVITNEGLKDGPRSFLDHLVSRKKPVILVINKCDLVRRTDLRDVLNDTYQRACPPLECADVVFAVADPLNADTFPRDIDQLVLRMLDVLKSSGKDILLANLVGKLDCIRTQLRDRLVCLQGEKADKHIKLAMIGAGAVALEPLPIADYFGITAIQVKMAYDLSRLYGYNLTWERSKELVGLMASGWGLRLFASLLKGLPGFGTAGGMAIQLTVASGGTYAMGHALKKYYESGMTLSDDELKAAAAGLYEEGTTAASDLSIAKKSGPK